MGGGSGLIAIAVAIAVIALLRFALWRVVRLIAGRLPGWGTGFLESRAWARTHPVRGWLRGRYPRFYAFSAARLKPGKFSGLPLTLMVLAALYAVLLLGGLVEDVLEAQEVLAFDRAANAYFAPWRSDRVLLAVFLWITDLGAGPALTAVALAMTALLWASRRMGPLLPLWVTFLGAQATTWAGKFAIGRERPAFIEAVSAASPAFPSGHSTGAMALYGFLAYLLARTLPDLPRRFDTIFWAAVLIAAIAFSRIFLSVHYTTDVASGLLVGVFWLLVGVALAERHHAALPPAPA